MQVRQYMAFGSGILPERFVATGIFLFFRFTYQRILSGQSQLEVDMEIVFNAYSFLQKACQAKGIACKDARVPIREGETVMDLVLRLGLDPVGVEAVMVNRKVEEMTTVLQDGDRVALLPPGTPGPHRFLLGIRKTG